MKKLSGRPKKPVCGSLSSLKGSSKLMEHHAWIEELVARYEKPLCRYAYSLTRSDGAAQDAVQETFLRLCKADPAKLAGREAAWLFRVCRSRVIDTQRKENPMSPLTPACAATLTAPGRSPADQAMHHDQEALVPQLLNQLPEKQREAIRLKFQQHLSYRDIATVLATSEGNVGFLIHTGIKTLRETLSRQGALS
jgi:RNA polymerase sigma-70 factor (ECF subfamily)